YGGRSCGGYVHLLLGTRPEGVASDRSGRRARAPRLPVDPVRRLGAARSVDRVAQAASGREIRTVQVQDDAVAEMKSRRDLALDGCPGWNAADARHVDRDARAVAAVDAEAADDEIALRDRIDLP